MPYLKVRAQMTIRPRQLAGFGAQAAELIRLTHQLDTRTLRYDWYINDIGTRCEVHELYEDELGLFEHNQHIASARAVLFRDFADDHRMTVYGPVSERLADLGRVHAGGFERYTFIGGLQSPAAPGLVVPAPRQELSGERALPGRNWALLGRAVAAYNEGDLDGYLDLYTDDAVLRTPEGIFRGKSELRARFSREPQALSDIRFEVISFIETEGRFADEFVLSGLHTGPLSLAKGITVPPTGRRLEIQGMEMVEVREGRMSVDNLYYDQTALLAQLGGPEAASATATKAAPRP